MLPKARAGFAKGPWLAVVGAICGSSRLRPSVWRAWWQSADVTVMASRRHLQAGHQWRFPGTCCGCFQRIRGTIQEARGASDLSHLQVRASDSSARGHAGLGLGAGWHDVQSHRQGVSSACQTPGPCVCVSACRARPGLAHGSVVLGRKEAHGRCRQVREPGGSRGGSVHSARILPRHPCGAAPVGVSTTAVCRCTSVPGTTGGS